MRYAPAGKAMTTMQKTVAAILKRSGEVEVPFGSRLALIRDESGYRLGEKLDRGLLRLLTSRTIRTRKRRCGAKPSRSFPVEGKP